jgi:hypothetical protein
VTLSFYLDKKGLLKMNIVQQFTDLAPCQNAEMVDVPDYIWHCGRVQVFGYHYGWQSQEEAAYRALVNGDARVGTPSLLSGHARNADGIRFRSVDVSRPFYSPFGNTKLRHKGRRLFGYNSRMDGNGLI